MPLLITFPLGSTDSPDPETVDLHAWRGATFRKDVHLVFEDQSPRDLTGYTAHLDVTEPASELMLHSFTTANGGITIDEAAGVVSLFMSDDETEAATWTSGLYDLFLAATDVELVLHGGFVLQGP